MHQRKYTFHTPKALILACFLFVIPQSFAAKTGEWQTIFNGKDLSGWKVKIKGEHAGDDRSNTFRVEHGNLTVSYQNYDKFDDRYGHLFYMTELSHYKLRLQYRFIGEQMSDGPGWARRNSGVMLHGQHPDTMARDQSYPVSIEAQLLGGFDNKARTTGNVCSPGTHFEMAGKLITKHCTTSSSKTFFGEQWVTIDLEVKGGDLVRHVVNGELVFEYSNLILDEKDKDAKPLLQSGASKQLSQGYFSLQSESHPIQFRNIELMELAH